MKITFKSSIIDNIVNGVMGMVLYSIYMSNISFEMLQLKRYYQKSEGLFGRHRHELQGKFFISSYQW